MTNWCQNVAVISHPDQDRLIELQETFINKSFLQSLIPCPDELLQTSCGRYDDPVMQAALLKQHTHNIQTYGYPDWHVWRNTFWGTAWDVGGEDCSDDLDDGELLLTFDSAWSPPIAAYKIMLSMGFNVSAYYYEPDMHYAGIFEDGVDTLYDDWNDASIELPAVLNDQLAIAAQESDDLNF